MPDKKTSPDDQQPPVADDTQPKATTPVTEERKKLDVTIPGGKYLNAAGQLVNANNEPIDETGRVLKLQ